MSTGKIEAARHAKHRANIQDSSQQVRCKVVGKWARCDCSKLVTNKVSKPTRAEHIRWEAEARAEGLGIVPEPSSDDLDYLDEESNSGEDESDSGTSQGSGARIERSPSRDPNMEFGGNSGDDGDLEEELEALRLEGEAAEARARSEDEDYGVQAPAAPAETEEEAMEREAEEAREQEEEDELEEVVEEQRLLDLDLERRLRNEAREHLGEEGYERMGAEQDRRGLHPDTLGSLKHIAFFLEARLTRTSFAMFRLYYPLLKVDSEFILLRLLRELAGLEIVEIIACINGCMARTGTFSNLKSCAFCHEDFLDSKNRPVALSYFIPPNEVLRQRLRDPSYAALARTRDDHVPSDTDLSSPFDGDLYRRRIKENVVVDGEELEHKYYDGESDAALLVLLDGFQLFKRGHHDCWPIIGIHLDLDVKIRYKTRFIIPIILVRGPHHPKAIDTFLYPMVVSAKLDARFGHRIFNAFLQREVVQRIYYFAFSGDMPALAMLMHFLGHGANLACRQCKIMALRVTGGSVQEKNRTTNSGFPLTLPVWNGAVPTNPLRPAYDIDNLPLRDHTSIMADARGVADAANRETAATAAGIGGLAIVAELPGVDMLDSMVLKLMHLFFENIVKNLLLLWKGAFKGHKGAFVLPKEMWDQIDEEILLSFKYVPASFGRRMPAPGEHLTWFTAEDFSTFLLVIGPAVLFGRLPTPYYNNFLALRDITSQLLAFSIPRADVLPGGRLDVDIKNWYKSYETLYYCQEPLRLNAVPITVHSIVHLCRVMNAVGPLHLLWSFCMERYCQTLGNLVTSKLHPWTSLFYNVIRAEQLKACKSRYSDFRQATSAPPSSTIRATLVQSDPDFTLFSPNQDVIPSPSDRTQLLVYLVGVFDHNPPPEGYTWKFWITQRLPTKLVSWAQLSLDGDLVNAALARELSTKAWGRECDFVVYDTLVRNKKRGAHQPPFVPKSEFGQVQRFWAFSFEKKRYLVAAVRISKVEMVAPDVYRFRAGPTGQGAVHLIGVDSIRGSIGRLLRDKGIWWGRPPSSASHSEPRARGGSGTVADPLSSPRNSLGLNVGAQASLSSTEPDSRPSLSDSSHPIPPTPPTSPVKGLFATRYSALPSSTAPSTSLHPNIHQTTPASESFQLHTSDQATSLILQPQSVGTALGHRETTTPTLRNVQIFPGVSANAPVSSPRKRSLSLGSLPQMQEAEREPASKEQFEQWSEHIKKIIEDNVSSFQAQLLDYTDQKAKSLFELAGEVSKEQFEQWRQDIKKIIEDNLSSFQTQFLEYIHQRAKSAFELVDEKIAQFIKESVDAAITDFRKVSPDPEAALKEHWTKETNTIIEDGLSTYQARLKEDVAERVRALYEIARDEASKESKEAQGEADRRIRNFERRLKALEAMANPFGGASGSSAPSTTSAPAPAPSTSLPINAQGPSDSSNPVSSSTRVIAPLPKRAQSSLHNPVPAQTSSSPRSGAATSTKRKEAGTRKK
ncbi:hypothetical protein P7C70_g6164, partial [Phenoliferia sp. Uapishka_3]